jgi:hypothetical protein
MKKQNISPLADASTKLNLEAGRLQIDLADAGSDPPDQSPTLDTLLRITEALGVDLEKIIARARKPRLAKSGRNPSIAGRQGGNSV